MTGGPQPQPSAGMKSGMDIGLPADHGVRVRTRTFTIGHRTEPCPDRRRRGTDPRRAADQPPAPQRVGSSEKASQRQWSPSHWRHRREAARPPPRRRGCAIAHGGSPRRWIWDPDARSRPWLGLSPGRAQVSEVQVRKRERLSIPVRRCVHGDAGALGRRSYPFRTRAARTGGAVTHPQREGRAMPVAGRGCQPISA